MILLVNSVVAGATVALVFALGAGLPAGGAVAVGVVAVVASLGLGLLYESRRLAALIVRDAPAEATEGLT